jgi:hypothetical protein
MTVAEMLCIHRITKQNRNHHIGCRDALPATTTLRKAVLFGTTASHPGHHKEKADAKASAFSFFDYYFYYQKGMFNFFFI